MNPAVLVIDVQRGLFDREPRPYEADATVARINRLTDRARRAGIPVFVIQHEQAAGELAFGSDGWQPAAGLAVDEGDGRVRKTTPDAFLRTDLLERLREKQVDTVVICGYASEFCVDTTTRRAAALGFSVLLAADGHTTHDKAHASAGEIRAHHNATLANIRSFGPTIMAVPSAEIGFAGLLASGMPSLAG